MKRVVFLCLLIFISAGAYSDIGPSSLDIAVDVAYIDPFIDHIIYNEITIALNINKDLSLRIPINIVFPTSKNLNLVGIGGSIDVLYRPFLNGIFISFALAKIQYLTGYDAPFEKIQYLNKLSFGYTFHISEKVFIEPSVAFFNINGIYEDSILALKDSFNDFPSVRASLLVGYKIINL
jgi:hypothetical protein